jgi:hypothetical protein
MREGFYDPFCLLYDVSTEMCLDSFELQNIAEHICFTVTGDLLLHLLSCLYIIYCLLMNIKYDEWDILVSCCSSS